jgi:23S rRNA G2069 N7-methylase RlmK/C1962 C5-methylase RlmI
MRDFLEGVSRYSEAGAEQRHPTEVEERMAEHGVAISRGVRIRSIWLDVAAARWALARRRAGRHILNLRPRLVNRAF